MTTPKKDPDARYGDEPGIAHFQRPDNRFIDYEPSDDLFDTLPYMSDETLLGLGLQPWDQHKQIWLFPVEWHEHIPEGFEITSITGSVREFDPDVDQKEARRGAMPYGISRPEYDPEERDRSVVEVQE